MAYIQPKKLTWTASTSSDVVAHRVYVVSESSTIDPISSPHADVAMPTTEYEFPGVFTITDGNYKVGVAAIDDVGNISNIAEKVFPFDFTPPLTPTNLQVVDG